MYPELRGMTLKDNRYPIFTIICIPAVDELHVHNNVQRDKHIKRSQSQLFCTILHYDVNIIRTIWTGVSRSIVSITWSVSRLLTLRHN